MSKRKLRKALRRIENCCQAASPVLDLRELDLIELPQSIFELTHLTELDVSFNKLTALPPEIGELTALVELY